MKRIVALVVGTVFLSACASMKGQDDPKTCAMMFGAAGAVGGGLGGYDYSRNHDDGAAAGIGVGSMLAAAALGYGICALLYEEPPPPPRKAAAEPPPPPPPPPAPAPPDPCTGRIVLRGVTFAFDSDEITGASMATLDVAAETLRECPNVRTAVEGYTDSIGTEFYNQALSQRRADSVKNYLISHDVSSSRLEAKGFGESNPIADNSTEDGRALNRRVELTPLK